MTLGLLFLLRRKDPPIPLRREDQRGVYTHSVYLAGAKGLAGCEDCTGRQKRNLFETGLAAALELSIQALRCRMYAGK